MDLDFLKQNNLGMNVLMSAAIVLVVYYGTNMISVLKPANQAIVNAVNSIPLPLDGNIKLVVVGLILVALLTYLFNSGTVKPLSVLEEGFEDGAQPPMAEEEEQQNDVVDIQKEDAVKNANTPVESNEVYSSVEGQINTENKFPKDCFPKDQLQPKELLPGDYESSWKEVAPNNPGALEDQNLLEAGYHVGVNTVGQSLRNANLQLRSEPANPQVKVSPWMQSTIDPDANRKPMEIGGQ
tara:strand:- start:340 stop:1056 length:717 start_codon:yes stop_codon:yes gene_type:complete